MAIKNKLNSYPSFKSWLHFSPFHLPSLKIPKLVYNWIFLRNFHLFTACRCLVVIKFVRLVKTSHRSYCEGLIMCLTMRNSWLQCCQFINGGGQPQGREYSHLVVVRLLLISVQHCPQQLNLNKWNPVVFWVECNVFLTKVRSRVGRFVFLSVISHAHTCYI